MYKYARIKSALKHSNRTHNGVLLLEFLYVCSSSKEVVSINLATV